MFELEEYGKINEFILRCNLRLVDNVIKGRLFLIHQLYLQQCGAGNNKLSGYSIFLEYIDSYNQICEALVIEKTCSKATLIDINFSRAFAFKQRLQKSREIPLGTSHSSMESGSSSILSPAAELLQIVQGPLYISASAPKVPWYLQQSLDSLQRLLEYKTAQSILSKQKVKQNTTLKPFYEVCTNPSHKTALTKMFFSKGNGLDKNDLPNPMDIHYKIFSTQSIFPSDISQCTQSKIHYIPILNNHTDVSLGDCSYLDTCHKMRNCRYLHYYSLYPPQRVKTTKSQIVPHEYSIGDCFTHTTREVTPAQWIKCDVRYLPFSILGKFAVIVSDPAWDIHMSLPYGTCKDGELLSLDMGQLQDEGIIFLWVTGRSIEVGRKALKKWGYENTNVMIWVKLNQLKRTIVTGRTGHWLNHSKEHLLVGIKGNPSWLNRQVDPDIIVSGTRETSRKPDEVYDIAERLAGIHSRKLEIFGRSHNTRPGWLTIGNQLEQTYIHEQEVKAKYEEYLTKHSI